MADDNIFRYTQNWVPLFGTLLICSIALGQERGPQPILDLDGAATAADISPSAPSSPTLVSAAYTSPADGLASIDAGSLGKVISVPLPGGLIMRFSWCPAGSFTMGSPEEEEFRNDNEEAVEVTLSQGFWLAQTPCTQAQWQSLMGTTPVQLRRTSPRGKAWGTQKLEGPDLPMYYVSPEDAHDFCSRLTTNVSLSTGWKITLPTEAQWEYACRAGTTTAYHVGDEINETQANFFYLYRSQPETSIYPVASFPPNAWGIYDMNGNVSQLCADWYCELLTGGTDPTGPVSGTGYVSRGSDWSSTRLDCRSANRQRSVAPGDRFSGMGFRPVLTRHTPKPVNAVNLVDAHPAQTASPLSVKVPAVTVSENDLNSLQDDLRGVAKQALVLVGKAQESELNGRYQEAESQYRKSLGLFENVWPQSRPLCIAIRLRLSQCAAANKQWHSAVLELKLALALQDSSLSDEVRMLQRSIMHRQIDKGATPNFESELALTSCYLLAATLAEAAKGQREAVDKALYLQQAQIFAARALSGHKSQPQPNQENIRNARQMVVALTVALQNLPPEARKGRLRRDPVLPAIPNLTEAARHRVKSSSRPALAEAEQQWRQATEMYDADQSKDAKPLFAAATATYQLVLGAEHPHTLKCRSVNLWLQHSFSDRKAAEREFREILAAQQRVLPKDDPMTTWCRERLLSFIRHEYEPTEALELARVIVASHSKISGPDHMRTLSARQDFASILVKCGLDADAEKEYLELTSLWSRKYGVDTPQSIACRDALGHLLVQHGQPANAIPHLLSNLVFRDSQPFASNDYANSILDLAYSFHLVNRPAESLLFAQRAAIPKKGDPITYKSREKSPSEAELLVNTVKASIETLRDLRNKTAPPDNDAGSNSVDNQADDQLSNVGKIEKIGLTNVMYRALRGDVECQYLTSIIYEAGAGVQKNSAASFNWSRLAAEAGYQDAQDNVGVHYSRGEGVTQDYHEANRWFQKAAASGSPTAMYNLGMSYMKGHGFEKDSKLMLYWYEKSALSGLVNAQRFLGCIFQLGSDGVGQDLQASCRWLAMGAEQDDAECLYMLGNNYFRGEGVQRNKSLATEMWRRAAEQGNKEAQFKLGCSYASSDGLVVQDFQQSYIWLKLAAAQGHENAAKFASTIGSTKLSKKGLSEAATRIKEFSPREPRPEFASVSDSKQKQPKLKENDIISTGTGFFVSRIGHLVTNYHVIKGASGIRVLFGPENEVPATIIARDKNTDLAILKINLPDSANADSHRCLPIASLGGVKLGTTVATVGFPNISVQGFSPKLSKGEISSLAGAQDDPGQFQISVPLQPGNSGGALVDTKGNVVGVVSSILDQRVAVATSGTLANNVAYAVKSSLLVNLIESVPNLSDQLLPPSTEIRTFEDMVEDVQRATVMILVKTKSDISAKPK